MAKMPQPTLQRLDEQVDHIRGPVSGRVILEYGDYLQHRFWDMHGLLFHRQQALEEEDLRRYAAELELDVARFDSDRFAPGVLARVRRDLDSGIASGEVLGTPTLFIDGVVHTGSYDADSLLEALARD
jgi:protein-disulfide isomerase